MIIDPKETSTNQIYRHLTTAIAPRPICFASTISADGIVNLSPFSFFNVFSSDPAVLVFSPVNSGRDGSKKDTLNNVLEVPEVVINVVNFRMAEGMSKTSAWYPSDVNEFPEGGFTEVPSELVKPPRVLESPVSIECSVERVVPLGDGPGAGNLVLAKVLLLHVNDEVFGEDGQLDTGKLDLIARLGGSDYCRVTPESMFTIPKP